MGQVGREGQKEGARLQEEPCATSDARRSQKTRPTHTPSLLAGDAPESTAFPGPRTTGSEAPEEGGALDCLIPRLSVLQARKLRPGEGRALPRARQGDGHPGGTWGGSQARTGLWMPHSGHANGQRRCHREGPHAVTRISLGNTTLSERSQDRNVPHRLILRTAVSSSAKRGCEDSPTGGCKASPKISRIKGSAHRTRLVNASGDDKSRYRPWRHLHLVLVRRRSR